MSNHLQALLEHWYPLRDQQDWVLGTIIATRGSSYRKAGAMMLFGGLGQALGLLSGGCLERDLARHAARVMMSQRSERVCYDSSGDSDIAWQLGLGCGGVVTILLQPLSKDNQFLQLDLLHQSLQKRHSLKYLVDLSGAEKNGLTDLSLNNSDDALIVPVTRRRHLMVFGGGVDAQPLVSMAATLGWCITLVDKRCGYAKASDFSDASQILNVSALELYASDLLRTIDAAIVMTHNISLDAEALLLLQQSNIETLRYIGLLGPEHRKDKVLAAAHLDPKQLPKSVNGPMGLNIGGHLPESIALSALAECHRAIESHQWQDTDVVVAVPNEIVASIPLVKVGA